MQKWEYVAVTLLKSYGMNYRANEEKQGQWKDKPIHVVLNDLGKAGFELVTYDGDNYIFKRPKGQKPTTDLKLSNSEQE